MTLHELFDSDATALAAGIRSGEVSASEVLELALERIDERNPALNAVIARRDDEARADVAAGLPDGPLTGVPFVVKDLGASVAGMPHTDGSRLFAGRIADADSELVRRWREAGGVPIGMTNSPELGKSPSTEPLLYGPTHNPHRHGFSSGGSSGGSAAAVAAGIVPVAHGNDGGGSIRIPASMCGLIGLKPSRGRVTAWPDKNLLAYPLGINHVLSRSVRDTALLLDVLAGPMPGDPYVIERPRRPYVEEVGADPGRLRIALSTVMPSGASTDEECVRVTIAAAAALAALGHEIVEATPNYPVEETSLAMSVLMRVPLIPKVDDRLAELGRDLADDDLEPMTRMMYEAAARTTGAEVNAALQAVEAAARRTGAFMADHDVLLTPTIARTVPPHGLLDTTDLAAMGTHASAYAAMTSVYNVTGQPAISLPFGTDQRGLPVGVQLVGAFGAEDVLLRLSAQLEATGAWDTSPVVPAT